MTHSARRPGVIFLGFAAMLLLSWLLAIPAFAQEDVETGGATAEAGGATATAGEVNIQYQDCDQVIAAAADQSNSSGAGAAGVAQYLDIDVDAVQNCLQNAPGEPTDTTPSDDNGDDTGGETLSDKKAEVLADTIPQKVLPATGGISAALLAGVALVGAGMSLLVGRRRGS